MALELWRPRLMGRSPFRDVARLEREMEDAFGWLPAWPWGERERGWAPAVDMVDRKEEIILRADLPGLDEKDIEVTVQDGSLALRGERKEETEEKKGDYYCCERRYGLFARTLPLPAGVEADKVTDGDLQEGRAGGPPAQGQGSERQEDRDQGRLTLDPKGMGPRRRCPSGARAPPHKGS